MYRILIAEDDVDILEILKIYLENEKYEVILCEDGVSALTQIKNNKIDMAILDIMMPKMNGYELTKKIREISNMPILFLSAKNQDSEKILGLKIGADDYLTKPFNPLEVVARVNSNLRRYHQLGDINTELQIMEKGIYKVGDLVLNANTYELHKDGKNIPMTPAEYKILELLMNAPGRVFTKAQVYEHINGETYLNDDSTLMVHICNLRDKLEETSKNPKYIKTIRGIGYKSEKTNKLEE